MPRWCWRLISALAIVWATWNAVAYHSYAMGLSVAAGYCLARGIRGREREQARKAAADDHPHPDP